MRRSAQHGRRDSHQSRASERSDQSSRGQADDEKLRADIAERAYARYLARGGGDGHTLEDWLEAEQEVRQRSR